MVSLYPFNKLRCSVLFSLFCRSGTWGVWDEGTWKGMRWNHPAPNSALQRRQSGLHHLLNFITKQQSEHHRQVPCIHSENLGFPFSHTYCVCYIKSCSSVHWEGESKPRPHPWTCTWSIEHSGTDALHFCGWSLEALQVPSGLWNTVSKKLHSGTSQPPCTKLTSLETTML